MSQVDLDRVRDLIRNLMVTRGLTWDTFGRQMRTAQRFLDGENIRPKSLKQLQDALGIGGLTFFFLERGQWAQVLDQPNADDVRSLIESMIPAGEQRRA